MPITLSTEELSAWIRLSLEPGVGPAQARSLLAAVGLPHDIYALSVNSLAKFIPHDLARQLHLSAGTEIQTAIERTLAWVAEPGHHLLTLADPAYPQSLLDTHDPPLLLYVNGQLKHLAQPMISMVGARNATAAGVDNATAFAEYLARQGWCIVSGLALGIDTAAHTGALRAGPQGGSTVAILGTGIDVVYPSKNRDLAHRIAEQGALVSEFPLGMRAIQYHFPKRNRIVAGLARGVLVVEAAKQSGSLITARLAAEMGREVFAIPGSIHSPLSRGCHALIRQGAKLVESAEDIHEELGRPSLNLAPGRLAGPNGMFKGNDTAHNATKAAAHPFQARRQYDLAKTDTSVPDAGNTLESVVLDALGYDPVHLDTLQARTQLDLAALNKQLLELELNDDIARLDDGRFQRR